MVRDPQVALLHYVVETQRLVNTAPYDAERVMAVVMERVQSLTKADGAAVELAEGDVVAYRAVSGLAAGSDGLRVDRASSLSGLCLQLGMPLVSRDAETDPRIDLEACGQVGVRSVAAAPIVHRGQGVGVLTVVSAEPDRFGQSETDIVELMANLVATALSETTTFPLGVQNPLQDAVTGSASYLLLMDRLGQQVYESRRYGRSFGLFVIDLDHFSDINDALGRAAGDAVLRAVAKGLSGTVRSGDTLARLEGDQFVILAGNADRAVTEERLKGRIDSVVAAVNDELDLDGFRLAASVGVVWSSGNDASAESLLTAATTAVYRAKRRRYAGDRP
jgi:diguanylate cyclase